MVMVGVASGSLQAAHGAWFNGFNRFTWFNIGRITKKLRTSLLDENQ